MSDDSSNLTISERSDTPPLEMPMKRNMDPVAFFCGSLGLMANFVGLIFMGNLAALGMVLEPEEDSEPFEYIEARLLKLGEEKPEKELPDRIVPAMPTAPQEVLPLDKEENKPPPKVKKEKPIKQADAVDDDKLREVFEKARAFAEIQDDYVPEGHPDGVPDGHVTDPALASLGATYGHKITRLIQDRWSVATLIPESQLKKLWVKVLIRVDVNMVITSVKFKRKTKNTLFNDSVQNAIDRVRTEVRKLPSPPEAIAPKIFGGGILLRLNGAQAASQ